MLNRTEDVALLMARLLVAALSSPAGSTSSYISPGSLHRLPQKGVPYAKVVAALDVAVEVVGPVALILGLWPMWTALVLIGFMAVTTWTTYRFGMFTAVFRQPQLVPLMKNLAIMAGLLFYAVSGPGAWSRTGLRRA